MSGLVTIASATDRLRAASSAWHARGAPGRLAVIGRFRRLLAGRAVEVARLACAWRSTADTLTAEILPLLEAARFLERRAAGLLAPVRLGSAGRPLWLAGVEQVVIRAPFGAVLILGPSNYPLMLPGIQALQALAAGNAVAWKPGRGGAAAASSMAALLFEAGLPTDLLDIAGEDDAAGERLASSGFDRIVLTGSAATGRAVLARAAESLTPCTVELSGADPVFVLSGADPDLVIASLAYGLRLNGGATCIAPRRVIVQRPAASWLERRLAASITGLPPAAVAPRALEALRSLAADAIARGARPIGAVPEPGAPAMAPLLLADTPHDPALLTRDIFAPWLALVPVENIDAAVTVEQSSRLALGASIFGPVAAARAVADLLPAGNVTINDLIVPTADPRLGFGGTRDSGFGTTRGPEGLLEMTRLRTISVRRQRGFRPHLQPPRPDDERRMAGLIALLHAGTGRRQALARLLGRAADAAHIDLV